jgi:hypothetical protein
VPPAPTDPAASAAGHSVHTRWHWNAGDLSRDGVISGADILALAEYLFFAPGDAMIWLTLQSAALSAWLSLDIGAYGGWGPGLISIAVWLALLWRRIRHG